MVNADVPTSTAPSSLLNDAIEVTRIGTIGLGMLNMPVENSQAGLGPRMYGQSAEFNGTRNLTTYAANDGYFGAFMRRLVSGLKKPGAIASMGVPPPHWSLRPCGKGTYRQRFCLHLCTIH